ncbi:MAG TPA: DUF1569 domain-containing protein [Pyrinomonadaceae bacterium]|nr:DUF1569 domain-containing protein [Pyrinomonadaceae bacterium]
MKTIFDKEPHDELLERLGKLEMDSERQWGKMKPSQMMEHVARALDMAMGKKPVKQMFVGKALSWIFRKEFLGEQPFQPNRPTGKYFIITDDPDFEPTRTKLSGLITEFHHLGESGTDGNIHGFFGPLTGKQWGETQYKHVDHHLRQFGV